MKLALIAAVARNRVIGDHGKLPWHIPADLKRFKQLTTGHTILMGRKTFEALGKPLPNRRHIVITRAEIYGIETAQSIEAALNLVKNEERVFVIGGGQIYSQLLAHVDEIYLTLVDGQPKGDAYFPPYEEILEEHFSLVHAEDHEGFAFRDYVRTP